MNQSSEKVLSYLAGSRNLEAVTVDDLQKLVAESPYFPVSQYLLAKKLKSENGSLYLPQVQKTAVFFSNPDWLQYQLTADDALELELQAPQVTHQDKPAASVVKPADVTIEELHPITTHFSENELIAASNLAHETLQETTDNETAEEVHTITESAVSATPAEQKDGSQGSERAVTQSEEEAAAITRSTNEATESFINTLDATAVPAYPIAVPLSHEISATTQTEVIELEEEMAGVSHHIDKTTDGFLEEAGDHTVEQPQDDEHDRMFQNIKAMLDASSEEADADATDAIIPIDPYYTIDYFASQGIKLELDQNPQDQLGQNLKKFTQWLKHMKKLGPEDATETINRTESEADIQQIADSSNTVREVVTEAMASVLEKQGKKDKAIELYNKLSFLYPHKNAYFADKIKKLKGI